MNYFSSRNCDAIEENTRSVNNKLTRDWLADFVYEIGQCVLGVRFHEHKIRWNLSYDTPKYWSRYDTLQIQSPTLTLTEVYTMICCTSLHDRHSLASSISAIIPAARGAAAEVPVCVCVQPLPVSNVQSVVTCRLEAKFVKYLENKRQQFWFCCHMLSGNCQTRPYLE